MPLGVLVEVFPFHQTLTPHWDFFLFLHENLNTLASSDIVLQSSLQKGAFLSSTVIFVKTSPMQCVWVGVSWGRVNNTGKTMLYRSGRRGKRTQRLNGMRRCSCRAWPLRAGETWVSLGVPISVKYGEA